MNRKEIELQIKDCSDEIQVVFQSYFDGHISMTDCVNQRNEIARKRIELHEKLKRRTRIEEPYIKSFK